MSLHIIYRSSLSRAEDLKSDDESTKMKPYESSHLTGLRSGLVDLYKRNKFRLSEDLQSRLSELSTGYENIINDLKKKGLMKLSAGKRELRRDGYLLICLKLMRFKKPTKVGASGGSWSASIFGWSFFTLLWNLISRPESVEDIMLPMITWKEDCLTIDEHVSCCNCSS